MNHLNILTKFKNDLIWYYDKFKVRITKKDLELLLYSDIPWFRWNYFTSKLFDNDELDSILTQLTLQLKKASWYKVGYNDNINMCIQALILTITDIVKYEFNDKNRKIMVNND